jgi:hypothetical protein
LLELLCIQACLQAQQPMQGEEGGNVKASAQYVSHSTAKYSCIGSMQY